MEQPAVLVEGGGTAKAGDEVDLEEEETMKPKAVDREGVLRSGVEEDKKRGKVPAELQQKKKEAERKEEAERKRLAAEAEKHTWDCDHGNPDAYDPLQKEYFTETGEYGGHQCAQCNLPMVGTRKQMDNHDNAVLIQSRLPAYVCKGKNRRDSDCEHIICPNCYRKMNMAAVEGLEQGVGARKRSRRCAAN